MHPPTSSRASNLSTIDLMVLFDLLGASNPSIPSYFPTTHWAYTRMARIEKQLREDGQAFSESNRNWFVDGETFQSQVHKDGVQDDHIHFLHRGVEILHIIPVMSP